MKYAILFPIRKFKSNWKIFQENLSGDERSRTPSPRTRRRRNFNAFERNGSYGSSTDTDKMNTTLGILDDGSFDSIDGHQKVGFYQGFWTIAFIEELLLYGGLHDMA